MLQSTLLSLPDVALNTLSISLLFFVELSKALGVTLFGRDKVTG
jgi:hypothetical protein